MAEEIHTAYVAYTYVKSSVFKAVHGDLRRVLALGRDAYERRRVGHVLVVVLDVYAVITCTPPVIPVYLVACNTGV